MGDAPQSDKPRVSLVLTGGEQQKERWENAVEEQYGTLAELVRTSVERELDGHHDTPETPQTPAEGEQVGEVLNAVRQVQATLGDMDSRISHLERQAETEGPKYDLKKAVFAVLPEEPDDVVTATEEPEIPDLEEFPAETGAVTAHEVAQEIGADVSDVQDALDDLTESTGQVQCSDVNHDGNHFWKVGGPE